MNILYLLCVYIPKIRVQKVLRSIPSIKRHSATCSLSKVFITPSISRLLKTDISETVFDLWGKQAQF